MKRLAYSLSAAAEETSLSEWSLRRAIDAGDLKAKRSSTNEKGDPTGKHLILADDLDAYLRGLADA